IRPPCFFFQAEDGIRDGHVTGVQTYALPIFIDATGPVERMLGRSPGDLAGSTLAGLVFPQEWPGVEALLAEAIDLPGTTLTQDIRLRRDARGWLRSQTAVVNLLDDATVGGLVLTIRDVSERRALEDQL